MYNQTKDYAENVAYANVLYYRHEYEALQKAYDAIDVLDDYFSDHCDGSRGRIDIDITLARISKSIKDCEKALRRAEKECYGV